MSEYLLISGGFMKKNPVLVRQDAIKRLIGTIPVSDQNELVELLFKKEGIDTNQAVVSRDLRQLGISKHKSGNKMLYKLPDVDPEREMLRLAVLDIAKNEYMVVVKCVPGMADFIGDYLDKYEESLGVLGTISGENTIFITPVSVKNINLFYGKISETLFFIKED